MKILSGLVALSLTALTPSSTECEDVSPCKPSTGAVADFVTFSGASLVDVGSSGGMQVKFATVEQDRRTERLLVAEAAGALLDSLNAGIG